MAVYFASYFMPFLIMMHNIILFHYSNVPQTTLPAISVERYLLLRPSLKILHLSPTFHFYSAMLQILVATQMHIHYIHDPFTFTQPIPLNGGLPPQFLEYSGLFRKNVLLTFFWN
jgi:hypothetical protein